MSEVITVVDKEVSLEDLCTVQGNKDNMEKHSIDFKTIANNNFTLRDILNILNKKRPRNYFINNIAMELVMLGADVFVLTDEEKEVEEVGELQWLPCVIKPFIYKKDMVNLLNYHKELIVKRYGEFIRLAKAISRPIKNIDDYNDAVENHKTTLSKVYTEEDGEYKKFVKLPYSVILFSEDIYDELFIENNYNELHSNASGVLVGAFESSFSTQFVATLPEKVFFKSSGWGDSLLKFKNKRNLSSFSLLSENEKQSIFDSIVRNGFNRREQWELEYDSWLKSKANNPH